MNPSEQVDPKHALSIQFSLEDWFQTAPGRALLASQRPVIEQRIERLFGFHQVEIGVSHRIPVGNPSSLGHKFHVIPTWQPDLPENTVISTPDELALDHDSVDLAILHHTLDFSSNPHQTLREASRIIKSSGYLLIVGFNPISLWGLRRLLSRRKPAPWNNRFLSGHRVEDWLNLLDFKVSQPDYYYYQSPSNKPGLFKHFQWFGNLLNSKVPLGAYYVIMAQKQVGSRIHVAPRWRRKAKVVGLPLANRVDNKSLE